MLFFLFFFFNPVHQTDWTWWEGKWCYTWSERKAEEKENDRWRNIREATHHCNYRRPKSKIYQDGKNWPRVSFYNNKPKKWKMVWGNFVSTLLYRVDQKFLVPSFSAHFGGSLRSTFLKLTQLFDICAWILCWKQLICSLCVGVCMYIYIYILYSWLCVCT